MEYIGPCGHKAFNKYLTEGREWKAGRERGKKTKKNMNREEVKKRKEGLKNGRKEVYTHIP
jgi:hypothetical protein